MLDKREQKLAVGFYYEIFFASGKLTPDTWKNFLGQVSRYLGRFTSWQLAVKLEYNIFHYYIVSPKPLPIDLVSDNFLLKTVPSFQLSSQTPTKVLWRATQHNFIDLAHKLHKRQLKFCELDLTFYLSKFDLHGVANVIAQDAAGQNQAFHLSIFSPSTLLSINFEQNKSYSYKKFPKYLKLDKLFGSVSQSPANAIAKIDTFPYAEDDFYLHPHDYDFDKHSLILGSSGAGKSKLISLLIHEIVQRDVEKYKIVVIDPHDNLKHDLSDLNHQAVIDFRTPESSIDLFKSVSDDLNASVELALSLFQNLLGQNYNGQIGRVLRFSIYLLLAQNQLSFLSLRNLLTDLNYRMDLVAKLEGKVPLSVTRFFLTDYNEIKNQFYEDAIAPIIAFIDEMQMVPVFNEDAKVNTLSQTLETNFLSVFSLNRLSLGNTVTQTIAGLLMQQLFLLVQTQKINQHLIIIVDEVAAIENPILARFLSELRKYHASLILAGQYFNQVSEELRASILANTANFYTFRVSKNDASLITQSLEMKLVNEKTQDDEIDLLTHLENRECIARISQNGKLLPAFRMKTVDCPDLDPLPSSEDDLAHHNQSYVDTPLQFNLTLDTVTTVGDIMKVNSTSRKKLP